MAIRKHKSERDLQGENKTQGQQGDYDTVGRRSMGDRLDTFRGRLSTNMREDDDHIQNEPEEGRRSGAMSRADTVRATSPLPNFTLFDLPAGMLSAPLNGEMEQEEGNLSPRGDEVSQGRRSFNIFRPSFDRNGNRARASKDGRLNSMRVEPSVANRSTILSRADDAIQAEKSEGEAAQEGRPSRVQRKPTSKSATPQGGSLTPSTQAGHTVSPYLHDDQSIDEDFDDDQIRKASRRALWKTDAVIMPLMALVVMLQYLDKVSK